MSNKRVKSLATDDDFYDDDDYEDEYVEEEEQPELTDEDRRQLREGTVKVRAALGSTYSISEKDIHDALWNYYYDIGKTVTYLKSEMLR
jgi:elongation factor 1 alpha-like protein